MNGVSDLSEGKRKVWVGLKWLKCINYIISFDKIIIIIIIRKQTFCGASRGPPIAFAMYEENSFQTDVYRGYGSRTDSVNNLL